MIKPWAQMQLAYVKSKDCVEITLFWGMLGYYRHREDLEIYPPDTKTPEAIIKYVREEFNTLIEVRPAEEDSLFNCFGHRFIPKIFLADDYQSDKFVVKSFYDAPEFLFTASENDRVYVRALEDVHYWGGRMVEKAGMQWNQTTQWLADPVP